MNGAGDSEAHRPGVGAGPPVSVPLRLWEQGLAAAHPGLAGRVGAFRRALGAVPSTASGQKVAMIAAAPGAGASTAVALLALLAAGFTANRVVVVDTSATSRVGELLGGRGDGRLPLLLDGIDGTDGIDGIAGAGEPVARSRIPAAGLAGAAVPVLALPAHGGTFTPQMLENTLSRLRQRADLVLIDTPSDPGAPVFRAALQLVDHVVLVVPADRSAPERLACSRDWLAAVPGPARSHQISVVLVGRTTLVTRWRPDLPWTLLRRDAALAGGVAARPAPRTVVAGLELLGRISRSPDRRSTEPGARPGG